MAKGWIAASQRAANAVGKTRNDFRRDASAWHRGLIFDQSDLVAEPLDVATSANHPFGDIGVQCRRRTGFDHLPNRGERGIRPGLLGTKSTEVGAATGEGFVGFFEETGKQKLDPIWRQDEAFNRVDDGGIDFRHRSRLRAARRRGLGALLLACVIPMLATLARHQEQS